MQSICHTLETYQFDLGLARRADCWLIGRWLRIPMLLVSCGLFTLCISPCHNNESHFWTHMWLTNFDDVNQHHSALSELIFRKMSEKLELILWVASLWTIKERNSSPGLEPDHMQTIFLTFADHVWWAYSWLIGGCLLITCLQVPCKLFSVWASLGHKITC